MYRYYGLGALCVALAALAQPVWAQETNHAPAATHKHMDGTSHSSDKRARLLTLQDALEKALNTSPHIKSAEQAVNAARGAEAQAGYWPNPELQFQAENIAGQGQYSGIDGAEMTYGLSQEIEIAGKRGYRQQAAANSVGMQRLDLQASKLNLIRDVRIAYAEAVAAQATLALADERRELAEELLATVNRRVKAAREPEIQLRKADITVNAARVAYGQAAREFTHTKHVLSSLWAGHHEGYLLDDSSFYTLTAPPKEQDVETALAEAPALKRWESETQRRETLLELEKANRLPNPRITAGVRDLREDGEQAFVLGVSMPIPVWNGNAGNITRAHHEALQAESQSMAASIALRNQAFQFLEEMVNAYEEANTLKENIIPAAEQSFTLAREGYRLGKFPYLEVLDSQRTLFEVKAQYITAMQAYHTAQAEVERLTTSASEGADHDE